MSGARLLATAGAAGLLLTAGASACGERSEPTGAAQNLYPVTITLPTDKPFVVAAPARRIAVLSPGARRVLDALGAGKHIAGMPVDSAGRLREPQLRALRPDFVVAPSGADERMLSRAAKVGRAPVYVVSDNSIREVEQTIIQLGVITAEPSAARKLVRAIEETRRLVETRLRDRRRVSVFVDTGFFTTVSDQSLIGDVVREARGHNVAGIAPGPGPFDVSALLRLQPHVYVTTSDSGTTLASLRRDRRTRKLRAVRAGRFAILDFSLLELGPSIGRGLLELARALHPDAFR